ncbi:hypothetical protein GCM10011390_02650 [Aureimonas endophytica]|uniref:Uncharacterized protein n=1 Tax=Aureimonas endophytica TaxID=2027858 RepID=A0A916ZC41_9HYPH|nr:hypothetical protein [Aureimonas endophytica]GGD87402.1 hypothetical protein GCM10011390_02650 [Aureimonas endophytica]
MSESIIIRIARAQARRQVRCAVASLVAGRDFGRDHRGASAVLDASDLTGRGYEWLDDLLESAEAAARAEVAPIRYDDEPLDPPDVEREVGERIAAALQDPRAPRPATAFRYGSR